MMRLRHLRRYPSLEETLGLLHRIWGGAVASQPESTGRKNFHLDALCFCCLTLGGIFGTIIFGSPISDDLQIRCLSD